MTGKWRLTGALPFSTILTTCLSQDGVIFMIRKLLFTRQKWWCLFTPLGMFWSIISLLYLVKDGCKFRPRMKIDATTTELLSSRCQWRKWKTGLKLTWNDCKWTTWEIVLQTMFAHLCKVWVRHEWPIELGKMRKISDSDQGQQSRYPEIKGLRRLNKG